MKVRIRLIQQRQNDESNEKDAKWKTPGLDNVLGYWLQNLTPLHDKSVVYLQECLGP